MMKIVNVNTHINVPITALEGNLPDFLGNVVYETYRPGPMRVVLFEGEAYWVVSGIFGHCGWYPRGFTVDLERFVEGEERWR